ncbi:YdcF family protein [Kineosporia succinea]|uniref:Uncharacterized SAM-binding protein YcdF (DUF218 family) n=1 Tax=Kineosporia succinea TaxID=84632 RepID=A0ABT9NZ78_9ACTN|nr:hypothetical protein [Kineosporia succinea]MDP9825729.1 uncharacterized SAM-binding protein YcdF (DUF218 family) [Kineosporia succinea]
MSGRGAPITLPRRRWIARLAVLVVVAVLVIAPTGGRLYSFPQTDTLDDGETVDAILALGGRTETAFYGQQLAEQGRTKVLIVSNPYPTDDPAFQPVHDLCASQPTDYRLICFRPDPMTTRGEARALGRLAGENGWDRVAVLAAKYHISRTRSIVDRCYDGDLLMVETPLRISPFNWTYQYVRQTLGYVKVAAQRGC